MPRFLDTHAMGQVDEETLKKLQGAPADELGVTHANIMYSKAEDKAFCLLDAPSKEAAEKHHEKMGMKCNWIVEVKTTS